MTKWIAILFIVVIFVGAVAWSAFDAPKARSGPVLIDSPDISMAIDSPLILKGQAKGTWFFEGSFPVFLVNWDGLIIAKGVAKATKDWMTADYVPFEVTLIFKVPTYGDNGTLIFKKDNPSGLPENDGAIELPVIFSK